MSVNLEDLETNLIYEGKREIASFIILPEGLIVIVENLNETID